LWLLSILFSVVLNLWLFGLMPDLVRDGGKQPEAVASLHPVAVVRLPPPEPPPPQKKEKPADAPREMAEPRTVAARPTPQTQKIRPQPLRFDFVPEMPKVAAELPALPMQTVAFEAQPLPELPPAPLKAFYGEDEIDGPLVPVSQVSPIYPLRARRKGIEGWVKVKFLVTESGTVEEISIVEASPKNLFEQSVLKAVPGWRFKPGTVEGQAVKTWASTTLEFRLE
jgi:protein TonB